MENQDMKKLRSLLESMLRTMRMHNGIGLAAPQVGLSKRIFVMELPDSEPVCVINPKIESVSANKSELDEGCLSFPDHYVRVSRPATIEVNFINYEGRRVRKKFSGLAATCFQHEYDHINGVTIVDHLKEIQGTDETI